MAFFTFTEKFLPDLTHFFRPSCDLYSFKLTFFSLARLPFLSAGQEAAVSWHVHEGFLLIDKDLCYILLTVPDNLT